MYLCCRRRSNILEKTSKKVQSISSKQKAQKNSFSKPFKISLKRLKQSHKATLRNNKITWNTLFCLCWSQAVENQHFASKYLTANSQSIRGKESIPTRSEETLCNWRTKLTSTTRREINNFSLKLKNRHCTNLMRNLWKKQKQNQPITNVCLWTVFFHHTISKKPSIRFWNARKTT